MDETNETLESQDQVDPWEAAFAALEPKSEETGSSDTDSGNSANDGDTDGSQATGDTQATDGQQNVSNQDEVQDGDSSEGNTGGLDNNAGIVDSENRTAFSGMHDVTEESIQQYEERVTKEIRDRAINEIAQEFIKRNVRHTNGVLGATIKDSDICKVDEDGVPRFFNPETGREFVGDNPRHQAQEWVDDYNKDLAQMFNEACQKYEEHLKKESAPSLAVMKFASTYEKLDDIRRGMFDNVIEDYEIKDDSGKVIGYSCDLDKALALVDRQISMIQGYAKKHQEAKKPTGPALDMKTSSGAVPAGEQEAPKNLEEAMLFLQNAQLEKLKK